MRDRDQEVERAAELVEPPRVPRDEGRTLSVGQVRSGEGGSGIGQEPLPERRVLLEAVEDDVELADAGAGRAARGRRLGQLADVPLDRGEVDATHLAEE